MAANLKSESLREKISETAFRRFLNEGYSDVRIRNIADECGISNSLLQHYFPKRSDLVVDPFFSLIEKTLKAIVPQVEKIAGDSPDADLACVNAFYHTFYQILHANHDRLLKLYTVILYDAVIVKRSTDLVLDKREDLIWQGNTYKSVLGSYAVNGIMAQFVVVYFDNRLTSDLMSFVDMALNMNYNLLELSDERRAYVRETSAKVVESPETNAFIRDYLDYIDNLIHR